MTIADINTLSRFLCDADSTSYTDAKLLITVNNAYEETVGDLIALDSTWTFGDSNYTSLPTGLKTLVAGTAEYQFDSSQLTLLRAEIKDQNGDWHDLQPIDFQDIAGAVQEYESTNGLPWGYYKREDFIVLVPAPASANVTTTNGLKVYFQRTADLFTSGQVTTGTKTPGFASPYHQLLAYKAALPYCINYKKDRVAMLLNEIKRLHTGLLAFYGSRDRGSKKTLSPSPISFR